MEQANDAHELQSKLSTPVRRRSSEGNYNNKISKNKEEKFLSADNANPREHRRKVYTSIFNGVLADEKQIFLKPGYRGIHIQPYPKHIKKMIKTIEEKVEKQNPTLKVPIYRGQERIANVDKRQDLSSMMM